MQLALLWWTGVWGCHWSVTRNRMQEPTLSDSDSCRVLPTGIVLAIILVSTLTICLLLKYIDKHIVENSTKPW